MAVVLKFDMPEGVFSALHKSPDEFAKELRLAAAVSGLIALSSTHRNYSPQ